MAFRIASNGAVVQSFGVADGGPVTLIVAGQHGDEPGPTAAMMGWEPKITHGIIVVVRCANLEGLQFGRREYSRSPALDMNRGWGIDPLPTEIWNLIVELGGIPTRVYDLHSSAKPYYLDSWSMGRSVLTTCEAGIPVAERLCDVMDSIEPDYIEPEFDGASGRVWKAEVYAHPPGSLGAWAFIHGAVAMTVEFDRSVSTEIQPPPIVESSQHRSDDPELGIRRRGLSEQTSGVSAVLDEIVRCHDLREGM